MDYIPFKREIKTTSSTDLFEVLLSMEMVAPPCFLLLLARLDGGKWVFHDLKADILQNLTWSITDSIYSDVSSTRRAKVKQFLID